jgi:hypothetical protein
MDYTRRCRMDVSRRLEVPEGDGPPATSSAEGLSSERWMMALAAAPRQLEPRFTDLQTASGLKIAFCPRQLTIALYIATNLSHLCFAGKGNIKRPGSFTYEPGAQPLSAFARAQEKLSEHTKAERTYLAITVGLTQRYAKCTLD